MKKIINKNTIFGFIIGLIVCGVTVYAVTYEAKDVIYKNDVSVKDALDDLYVRQTSYEEYDTGTEVGTKTTNRVKNVNIEKGNYILAVTEHDASSDDYNISVSVSSSNQIDITEISSVVSAAKSSYSSSAGTYLFSISAHEDGTISLTGHDEGSNAAQGGALQYILIKR